MALQLLYHACNIFTGGMAFFGSMLVCYRLYVWSNKTKHDVNYKDKSKTADGVIYLVDESIDKKPSVMDIVTPDKDAFDKPQRTSNMIKEISPNTVIKLIINTAGGDLFACHKILDKLRKHPSGYVSYIRNESMSAGTILALGSKEIVMNDDSYLGKIDPQVVSGVSSFPAINYHDLDKYQNGSCLGPHTINQFRTSRNAMNYLTDLLNSIITDNTLLKNISDHMIYSEQPHCKKFDFKECQSIGLPVREPTDDEKMFFN